MSDYGELVKRLDAVAARAVTSYHFEMINSAARAIESLLAEKASARDEMQKWRDDAFETSACIVERHFGKRDASACAGDIRALRSPAKEKADG